MNDDWFIIDGAASAWLEKPFKAVFVAVRTNGDGDGSRENPYRANTAPEFDKILEEKVFENFE